MGYKIKLTADMFHNKDVFHINSQSLHKTLNQKPNL